MWSIVQTVMHRFDPGAHDARDLLEGRRYPGSAVLDKPIARKVSVSRHVQGSYASDGELVAVVFLDAVKEGYFTPAANGRKAA